jgi:photosystem II stability/assembly factor-like uncharacterized protein
MRYVVGLLWSISLMAYTGSIDFSLDGLTVYEQDGYTRIVHNGCNSSILIPGAPLLPAHEIKILIPQDMEVDEIEIIGFQYEEINLPSPLYPCQSPDTSVGFIPPDPDYYLLQYPFPPELIYPLDRAGYTMGYNIATLKIYPFQYVSYEQKVLFYTHIDFALTYRPSQMEHLRPLRRSEVAQALVKESIKGLVINPEDIDAYAPSLQVESRRNNERVMITGCPSLEGNCVDYVIITNEALRDSFERLADYRTKSGLLTHVMTVESIDTLYQGADREERIRNFLKEANEYWGTIFVLLGGDVNIVPSRIVPGRASTGDSIQIPTDLYYSGLDGNWNGDLDWIYGEDIPQRGDEVLSFSLFLDFWFLDETNGLYTRNRCIYKTTTGGNSWYPVFESGDYITGLIFSNSLNGWALIDGESFGGDTLLSTMDGGESWQRIYPFPDSIEISDYVFVDNNLGFATGYTVTSDGSHSSGKIYFFKTGDGGETWEDTIITEYSTFNYFSSPWISTFDGNTVWLSYLTYDSMFVAHIYKSNDGGGTWEVDDSSFTNENRFELGEAIFLTDTKVVISLSDMATNTGYLLSSEDQGETWDTLYERPYIFYDVFFLDSLRGWIAGFGYVNYTSDGGRSFVEWSLGDVLFLKLQFIDTLRGFAISPMNLLYTTHNGGSEWNPLILHIPPDFSDLNPDLFLGRAPCEDEAETHVFLSKIMDIYEAGVESTYVKTALLMGGSYEECDSTGCDGWFARIKENLQVQMDTLGNIWWPTDWDSLVELYGPKTDPDTINHPYPWWQGDAELTKNNAKIYLSQGFHFVNHIDHSNPYAIGTGKKTRGGVLDIADVGSIANGDKLSIVMSIGCSTNAIDYHSIAEAFMNKPDGGAVAWIGGTRELGINPLNPIDNRDFKFFESLFKDSLPFIGQCFTKSQEEGRDKPKMNLLGDPAMIVWRDNPIRLDVSAPDSIPVGPQTLEITVSPPLPKGSFITLYKPDELFETTLEVYQTLIVTTPPQIVSFDISPETPGPLYLTIRSFNSFPVFDTIWVYPDSLPALSIATYIIDDDNEGNSIGNGDNEMNPGERIELVVPLRNAGRERAYEVRAILYGSESYLIDIERDVAYYSNISPEDTVYPLNPFVISVSPNASTIHHIELKVKIEARLQGGDPGLWRDELTLWIYGDSLDYTGQWVRITSSNALKNIKPKMEETGNSLKDLITVSEPAGKEDVIYIDSIRIENRGYGTADSVYAVLRYNGSECVVVDSLSFIGPIPPFSSIISTDGFKVISRSETPPNLLSFQLVIKDRFRREWSKEIEIYPPPAPDTIMQVENSENSITIGWRFFPQTVLPGDIAGYNIYRAYENSHFERVNELLIPYTFFVDQGLPPFTEYRYYVTTVDQSGNESESTDTISAWTEPPNLTNWPLDLNSYIRGSPKVCDINNDGKNEIVITTKLGKIFFLSDEAEILFYDSLPGIIYGSPAVGDMDNDGFYEIAVLTKAGKFKLYSHDGSTIWTKSLSSFYNSPVFEDVDNDSQLEVIGVASNGKIYIYEKDGTGGIFVSPDPSDSYFYGELAVADIDYDGYPEIVVGSRNRHTLYVWRTQDTTLMFSFTRPNLMFQISPAVGNIDTSTTSLEIIAVGTTGDTLSDTLYVLRSDGSIYWQSAVEFPVSDDPLDFNPTLSDIDGDGLLEVLVYNKPDKILIFNSDGSLYGEISIPGYASEITTADINGDGEIDILIPTRNGYLLAYQNDLSLIPGFPIEKEEEGITGSASIVDLNQDGNTDIVLGFMNQWLCAWTFPTSYIPAPLNWSMFRHDLWNTGALYERTENLKGGVLSGVTKRGLKFSLYPIMPNPAKGNIEIRFSVAKETDVEIKVYDVAGRRVKTIVSEKFKPGIYTIGWDRKDYNRKRLPSGIYFIRMETETFRKTQKVVILR